MLTITFFNEVHSKKSYLNLTLQFFSKRIKQSFKEFSKIKKRNNSNFKFKVLPPILLVPLWRFLLSNGTQIKKIIINLR